MGNLVTGKVRFSFVNVFEPRKGLDGGKDKYSITLLIPKTDTSTHQSIMREMGQVLEGATHTKFNGVAPTNPKYPLYDGDGVRPGGEPFGEECKGHYVITASSLDKPEVVDITGNSIMNRTDFYSGCYGRASLRFYAYNVNGNKGVGCGLGNVQKLEDGPSLTGKTSAAADFGTVAQAVDPITGQPI